jgi:hypothetical protein
MEKTFQQSPPLASTMKMPRYTTGDLFPDVRTSSEAPPLQQASPDRFRDLATAG